MGITWTKEWQAADDGTIVSGLDLKNIQDDITSGSTGDATSIWSVDIDAPTAGDDGKVFYYDHGLAAFGYLDVTAIIPTGVILMWSGAISAIPSGWTLCDGTSGTPNLTDRFVIHADADGGGTNDVGDSGGSRTISIAQLPPHTHTYDQPRKEDGGGSGEQEVQEFNAGTATSSVGSGADFLPKYYALAYIMKT